MLLSATRHAIDLIDDAMVALLAMRRVMSAQAGTAKGILRRPLRDQARECEIQRRARRLAARMRVPTETTDGLIHVLIDDACRQQSHHASATPSPSLPSTTDADMSNQRALLRLIPPPQRFKPLLRWAPPTLMEKVIELALSRALAREHIGRPLDHIAGRRLGIEAADIGVTCVVQWSGGRLRAVQAPAEASVRGSVTDLLLLAARLEDADTLFFQRRLVLTGDTELGLTVRNLLDRMPWEALPLGLRIALHRGARLARAAREAYHA